MAQIDSTTIFIVRHGEKADDGVDPPLSEHGHARATELVHLLRDETISAVFVTEFIRTQQTGRPVADAAGVLAQQYQSAQTVAGTILSNHTGEKVLVVGHSNTADDIANALGISGISDLSENSFDRLFVVHVLDGDVLLDRLRYGRETP